MLRHIQTFPYWLRWSWFPMYLHWGSFSSLDNGLLKQYIGKFSIKNLSGAGSDFQSRSHYVSPLSLLFLFFFFCFRKYRYLVTTFYFCEALFCTVSRAVQCLQPSSLSLLPSVVQLLFLIIKTTLLCFLLSQAAPSNRYTVCIRV